MSEEMKEGTSFFSIRALLPVVESFGFADGEIFNFLAAYVIYSTQDSHHRDTETHVWGRKPAADLQRVRAAGHHCLVTLSQTA